MIELVRTIGQEEMIRAQSSADTVTEITRTIVDPRAERSEPDARERDVQNSRNLDDPQTAAMPMEEADQRHVKRYEAQ